MRVLTVIDSLAVGGAEQSLAALTPHLVDRGVEMHVAYLAERSGVEADLVAGGARVYSLAGPGGRLRALLRTTRLIRRLHPDVVHTTLFKADVIGRTAAWLARTPVVSSFVTESYGPEHVGNPEYLPWKVRAAHLVDATTARFVDRFHAVSASSAEVMASRLRIDATKVTVIPRGRDPERLGRRDPARRLRTRESLGIDADDPIVLAAGRHYHMKGLDVLVSAWPEVVGAFPNAKLLIAGREGPATVEILRLIDEGDGEDTVTLLGYRSDVPDLMAAADVFVLPSRAEGSPGVLIEAMALELPTVASRIPSVQEIAGPGDPVVELVPVDSPSDMAKGIMRLLGDSELRSRLAEAARERYEHHYTLDAVADATVGLYESCRRG